MNSKQITCKQVLNKHAGEAGPLALQMGSITGAVDDLVHGYEQLVHTIPNITTQICNVHADTEQMAKQLEHRTRSLVDGYEYLQGLSTQLPEMFKETASVHRRTLQEAIHLMTPEDLALIAEQEQVLAKVRSELQSISHERVIMDVLMRPAINETRRIHAQAQGASNQVNQKRYTRGITDISGNSVAHASKVGVTQPPSASHVSPGSAHHADSSASAAFGSGRQHSGGSTTQVTFNNTAELLTSHIHIPQYSPIIASAESARRNGVRLQSQGAHFTNTFQQASLQQYQGRVSAGGFSDRHVRNTLNTQQIPNMRVGSLPVEVANLQSVPCDAVSAAEMERNFHKRRTVRRSKSTTHKVQFVEKEPLAKSLAQKLGHTEEEVQVLKTKLSQASHHFEKDQSKAIKRLQQLVEELRSQQNSKDKALLAAVEKLLKESLAGNKKPENRDAEILKALESLLVAPKQVALVDRLHEYKVLTARPKQPVAARTVPVVMPVPPPPVEDKPKCVEVQTEPLPAPVVETPHVPPPVVQQVIQPPPQPVIVQVPAQAGVERELIELMQTVVTSQQQTMQGNQALILSLIHERNAQPEPVFRDDVSEVSEETPPPAPAPPSPVVERAPTPPPAPVPPAPSPLRYSTAFGSVVLGGDLMVGPYTTQPAVIPSDQKPCLLRGIPLPSSRKRPPPDFSGDVPNLREGSSSDHLPTDPPPSDCTLGAGDVDGEGCVGEPSFKQEGAQGALAAAPLEPQDVHATSTEHKVNNNAGDVERTAPALQALEPTREQGSSAAGVLGLEGSGVSSTAGRGGSHQHTTPGIIEKVPVGSIPPHMRRIASAFTMRALSGPPDVPPPTAAGAAAASSSPSPSDPSAVTPCMSSEVGNVHTLMRNLHILSGMPVPAPAAQAITAEFIAEKISEGVQLGVKEALGLMDTHTPHRTYYDATSRPSARHGANPSSHISSNSNNRGLLSADKSHRLNYDQHHDQQEEVRHSLQLLKSRRGGAGSRRRGGTASSATDSTEFSDHSHCPQHQQQQHYNANHIRSTYYSRLPHVAVNTNDIHNNQDANKDLFQPPRRRELSAQKMRAEEADVMKEMELSRKHVHRLLQMDENSSFNDSVSLDEETAAHLRDPLLYNVQNADVSEMSSLDFGEHKNVRLVQRGEHRRRHQELFASQDAPHVRRDLPARSTPPNSAAATTPSKRSEAAGSFVGLGIVPLVSKVLAQSATEEALQNPRLCSAFAGSRSYEDDRNRGERDLSASVEDDMWVLDATAPLVQRNAGTGAGAESVSSRSILSLSTKSSSDSSCSMSQGDGGDDTDIVREKADSGEDILQLHGALSTADADAHVTATSSDVKAERDNRRVQIKAPSVPARSVAVSSSTDTSTSDSSGSAGRAAPRQSQLPRYSTTAKKTTTRSRSSSRGRSTESRRYPAGANMQSSRSDCDGPADVNTDRLAAQMMLNVLELHKPSNYTVQPYLTNPISTHTRGRSARAVLKRSKMYAGDSLDSTRSSESENTSQHSDINCTGSSVSSDDGDGKGLLDKMTNKGSSSLKLMGLGSSKLMTLRK